MRKLKPQQGKSLAVAQSGLNAGLCVNDFKISRFRDGTLVLSCGTDGMETDLVFASGAMINGDPVLEKQKRILEFILTAVHNVELTGSALLRSPG